MFPEPGAISPLSQTLYAQPALVALGLALADLWRSFGVEPVAAIGHSLGEITAAGVSGVLSREDALRFAAERGRLMQALPAVGRMAAVAAGPEALADLPPEVAVAAWNAPGQAVISGPAADVDRALADLAARGVAGKLLPGSIAFHSAAVEPILDDLRRAADLTYHPAQIDLVSNVSGRAVLAIDAPHWVEHARRPVRFAEGMRAAGGFGVRPLRRAWPGRDLDRPGPALRG